MINKKKIITLILIMIFFMNPISVTYSAFVAGGSADSVMGRYGAEVEIKIPATIPITPTEPENPDEGDYTPPGEEQTTEQVAKLELTENKNISGIAFEDYEQINVNVTEKSGVDELVTNQVQTNGKKDSNEPGVPHVKVELIKEGEDTAFRTTYTDETGKFEFLNIDEPGNYYLRFTYGLVENIDTNPLNTDSEYKKIRDILKYNGQDYKAAHAGNKANNLYKNSFYEKIIRSKKSYSQVVFLLDCSGSMVSDDNGDGIFEDRFNSLKNATKEAVESLFGDSDINEKLAISLIGFSNTAIKIKDMTNNKTDLLECLDKLTIRGTETPYGGEVIALNNFTDPNKKLGTNISLALEEAKNTFITNPNNPSDSNRIVVLISDGYATAHNGVSEYILNPETFDVNNTNNPDDEFTTSLNQIAELTRNDLNKTIEQGITLVSLLTKFDETDGYADEFDRYDNYFINKTFTNELDDGTTSKASNYYLEIFAGDEENYKSTISNEIPNIIKANHKPEEVIEDISEEIVEQIVEEEISSSIENQDRRRELQEYYSVINNEKANEFAIIDNLKGKMQDVFELGGASDYRKTIESISQNSYMYVDTDIYNISLIEVDDEYIYYDDGIGSVDKFKKEDYEPENIHLNRNGKHVANLILQKREEFKLQLEKKVTGIRVTLADGSILKEDIKTDFANISDITMLTYPLVMDEELMHGAKLEIEYTIRIKNLSSMMSGDEISIIDYINKDGSNLQYDLDLNLLSEPDKTNSYYLWESVDKQYLSNNNLVSEDVLNKLNDDEEYLIATYRVADYQNNRSTYPVNPLIPQEGAIDIKIVGQTMLTAGLEHDDLTYSNTSEILSYSNIPGRRIDYKINREEVQNGADEYVVYSSDYQKVLSEKTTQEIQNYEAKFEYYPWSSIPGNYAFDGNHEIDSITSIEVTIIPPFGEEIKQYTLPIALGIVFIAGLILIKKKVLK